MDFALKKIIIFLEVAKLIIYIVNITKINYIFKRRT